MDRPAAASALQEYRAAGLVKSIGPGVAGRAAADCLSGVLRRSVTILPASALVFSPAVMDALAHSRTFPAVAALIGGLVAAAAGLLGGWQARGSTAVPAALWAVAAALMVAVDAGLHAAGQLSDPAHAASVRLVVASLLVCPAMSLLGAKRPQHGIWQVIVASLAVVLAMPAASAELTRPGSPPVVHIVVRVFLAGLAALGWMNAVGTRRLAAATLVTAGGVLLVRGFLPGVDVDRSADPPWLDALAAWLVACGGMAAVAPRFRWAVVDEPLGDEIERPFLCLRETLGLAWTLRIAERFNGLAVSRGWPCRLSAEGLERGGDPQDTAWHRDAVRTFESIMRRFVSRPWLARHRQPSGRMLAEPPSWSLGPRRNVS